MAFLVAQERLPTTFGFYKLAVPLGIHAFQLFKISPFDNFAEDPKASSTHF